MSTPESIIEAFGRGLMQGAMSAQMPKEKVVKHKVVKTDDVERAVASYIEQKLQNEAAPSDQMDMFTEHLGDKPADESEFYAERLLQARARAQANGKVEEPRDVYDPNMPSASPWTAP